MCVRVCHGFLVDMCIQLVVQCVLVIIDCAHFTAGNCCCLCWQNNCDRHWPNLSTAWTGGIHTVLYYIHDIVHVACIEVCYDVPHVREREREILVCVCTYVIHKRPVVFWYIFLCVICPKELWTYLVLRWSCKTWLEKGVWLHTLWLTLGQMYI